MKKLLLALIGVCCCASLFAAGSTTPQGWTDDFAAARQESQKSGRPILLLFTGSDWCPACKMLKKKVLETEKFKKLAAEKLILVYVDFPQHTKSSAEQRERNMALAKKYGIEAFPTTVILSPSGEERGRLEGFMPDYLTGVQATIELIKDK